MTDDTVREAVERLARKLILRGYNETATTIRALLAAKEAAEAREREAVMQSLAHLGQAQEAWAAQKAAEAERDALRELIFGANANLWDRAELSERDEAGNQTILLWHPSGNPLLSLKIESYGPGLDTVHRDFVMSDLLDVFLARERALATLDQPKEGDTDE